MSGNPRPSSTETRAGTVCFTICAYQRDRDRAEKRIFYASRNVTLNKPSGFHIITQAEFDAERLKILNTD